MPERVGMVRIATEADAEAIAAIYQPYVRETAISFEEVPPTPAEIAHRLRSIRETHPYLVFVDGAGVLGYAYGSVHRAKPAYRWSVETTLYVARSAHRRGIGRALYTELLDLLTRQGFHSAFAGIVLPNQKSVGLHESMGFVYLGTFAEIGYKHGELHDLGWWRRTLKEGRPRHEPIPFASLVSPPSSPGLSSGAC
jgi:L-amino acid N-acyltransferase YncA